MAALAKGKMKREKIEIPSSNLSGEFHLAEGRQRVSSIVQIAKLQNTGAIDLGLPFVGRSIMREGFVTETTVIFSGKAD